MAPHPARDPADLKARALKALDGLEAEARALALRIHGHPELGFQEENAVAWVTEMLERHGLRVDRGVAGLPTAIVARVPGGQGGPTVGLIAEYDALAGLGHACGHNLMAAGMAAAAAALGTVAPDLRGSVVYYGTPAEESGAGKVLMLKGGAFQGCDAALQYHAGDDTSVATGCLAIQILEFEFTGRPAHSAAGPWNGLNALDGAIQLFNSVSALRQQLHPDTRVHGIITDGGQAVNIIPERAAASLAVRSPDSAYHQEAVARVEACARGAAEATGTTVRINRGILMESLKYNATLADVVKRNSQALGFEMDERFVGASTDLGNLSHALPTVSYTLPTCAPGVGMHTRAALEAGASEIGLAGMMNDARVMVLAAIDLLSSPGLVERAWADFRGGNHSPGSGD